MGTINVSYGVYSTRWHIDKALCKLMAHPVLSFDTETKGVYSKPERQEAKQYLKNAGIPIDNKRIALQVAENSGLSFPSLVNVTHFIFGTSEDHSEVMVCNNYQLELFIWNWVAHYPGVLLIHNTLFDLKLMFHRINAFPLNYEDTALMAKTLVNNVDVWKAKVGLKELMGSYYDPAWTLIDEYEPDNLKDRKFLRYAAIDGAATFKLWYDIQDYLAGEDEVEPATVKNDFEYYEVFDDDIPF